MGEAARALAVGIPITFEGQDYTVSPLKFTDHGKFEVWLEKRARDIVRRATDVTPEQEIKLLNEVTRDAVGGVYSWGSPVCAVAAQSLHGRKELLRLGMVQTNPEVDHELVDRIFDQLFAETEAAMHQANSDPKAGTESEAGP